MTAKGQRDDLIELVTHLAAPDTMVEPMPGIRLRHATRPSSPGHGLTSPAVCVVAQGAKVTSVGGIEYRYDDAHYLVTTSTLPMTSWIAEATRERPYLGVVIVLDPVLVTSVMLETGLSAARTQREAKAIGTSVVDADLLDVLHRIVRLLEAPDDAGFLLPLAKRELVFRLLRGEQEMRLRHIAAPGGAVHRITQAIAQIRDEIDRPLRIEMMARELGMSVSSFHHHFKAVTAMSPLQFQKQVRLMEARRLMLGEHLDATSAGFRVGYDDASHFSREYKRQFGEPPLRDVERLRLDALPASPEP